MTRDSIDDARSAAVSALLGRHGILGVGRTRDALVFFVRDRAVARSVLDPWSEQHDVPIDIEDVVQFSPAACTGGQPPPRDS